MPQVALLAAHRRRQPEHDQPAQRRQHAIAGREAASADGVEDYVHAASARDLPHLVADIRVVIVDHVLDAETAECRMFERRRRPDDRRAAQPRELSGRDPDASSGVVNKNCLAGAERRHPIQRQRRRQIVDGDGRAFRITEIGRHMERTRGRDDDGIGVASEMRERKHAIAGRKACYSGSGLVHGAGHFVPDDHRWLRRVGIEAESREDVCVVDAGGAHADADVAVAWNRVRRVAYLEHFRRAVPRDHGLAHGSAKVSHHAIIVRSAFCTCRRFSA
jgi:hypothetical protein